MKLLRTSQLGSSCTPTTYQPKHKEASANRFLAVTMNLCQLTDSRSQEAFFSEQLNDGSGTVIDRLIGCF